MNEEERMDELMTELRDGYNRPPETPREEMWAAIQSRLATGDGARDGKVVSLESVRRAKHTTARRYMWWTAAAAALVVLGLGIGRWTAPRGVPAPGSTAAEASSPSGMDPLRVASLEHLVRTESLLTLARADASTGRVQPEMGQWARRLLIQTRLLMDAQVDQDPVMKTLLQDLELVLVQMVSAASAGEDDSTRVQTEMNLALEGLEDNEVLSRIRAVVPTGARYLGT